MTRALEDSEVEKIHEAAKRPIDEDSRYKQQQELLEKTVKEKTQLKADKVKLEKQVKYLEDKVQHLSTLVLAKVLVVYGIRPKKTAKVRRRK